MDIFRKELESAENASAELDTIAAWRAITTTMIERGNAALQSSSGPDDVRARQVVEFSVRSYKETLDYLDGRIAKLKSAPVPIAKPAPVSTAAPSVTKALMDPLEADGKAVEATLASMKKAYSTTADPREITPSNRGSTCQGNRRALSSPFVRCDVGSFHVR